MSDGRTPGVVLDFDEGGHLVGIDIDQASTIVNWSHLELDSLPLKTRASS